MKSYILESSVEKCFLLTMLVTKQTFVSKTRGVRDEFQYGSIGFYFFTFFFQTEQN